MSETAIDQPPSIAQRLLRGMGRDFFKEGRPVSDCRTTDERIGWHEAQEQTTDQSNGK